MKLWHKGLLRVVSVLVILSFVFSNVSFAFVEPKVTSNLRNPQRTEQAPGAAEEIGTDIQRTWISGKPKPSQVIDAQAATQEYLIQAGRDKRIFSVAGPGAKDIKEQIAQYAAERTSVVRQLPYLDEKGQVKLVDRIAKAVEFHNSMVNSINSYLLSDVIGENLRDVSDRVGEVKSGIEKDVRFAIVLDELGKPFFFKDGDLINGKTVSITATSGSFKYSGYEATKMYQKGQRPRTIYRTLDEIEGYMELAQREAGARDAYIYKLLHEYFELQAALKQHRIESATITQKVNNYDGQILANWQKKQDELAAKKAEYDRNKVVAEVTSANISKFLKSELDGAIPKELVAAAEAELQKLVDAEILVDFKVFANGGDIHIYTTRSNAQSELEAAVSVQGILKSFIKAVDEARKRGDAPVLIAGEKPLSDLSYDELVKALEVRRTFKPLAFGERKAEAIGVLNASGTYVGAFNEFIWEVLCNPMTTAGLTIDPQGDRGFIIEVWDSIENKTYLFNSITENKKLRVLISEPGRYAIVAAYPPAEHKVPSDEPILAVSVKRIFDDGKSPVGDANPIVVYRAQSGLPAWGEWIEGFAKGQPILTYGGEQTRHMLAWRPTDISEANEWTRTKAGKKSIVTGFGYQSHQKGAIAPVEDMTGDKTLDVVRANADRFDDIFAEMPDFIKKVIPEIEPFNRPHPYDRDNKVDATYGKLRETDKRFAKNPDPKKDEFDPLLEDKGDVTVSTIKADVGSVPGHFIVHPYTMEGAPEMLEIAKQLGIGAAKQFVVVANQKKAELKGRIKKGEKISAEQYAREISQAAQKFLKEFKPIEGDIKIVDYKVWQVGDDVQLTIQHYEGAESKLIHSLAWDTLIYAAEKSELAQPYGYKQDILVDRLVSGNVQGAGPGYAEVSLKQGESVVNLSGDKSAPGVFTVPLLALINKALSEGKFKDGLIAEIWDINHSNRVFLDMTDPNDYQEALDLLRAPDRFAIKRIWETNSGWKETYNLKNFRDLGAENQQQAYEMLKGILNSRPLVAASTERLVLTAGEYVGKDDPTILFRISAEGFTKDDVIGVWQYVQVALGFMRGSHVGPVMPDIQGKALPHRFDGPPPISGWVINNITKEAGAFVKAKDAFGYVQWLSKIQEKANFMADVLRRQGAFPPHVVEGPDKEYTTAPKVMAALAAEKRGVDADNQAEELVANADPKVVSEKLASMLKSSVQDANKALGALPNLETADRAELEMFTTDAIPEETAGLIFSINALSQQGLGAIIPGLANRGKQIAVVVEKDHPEQLQILTELNDYILSGPQKIYVAFSVENAAETLKQVVSKVTYIGTDEDSGKTFRGVDKVVIAKQIIAALGKIENMTDALEEFKEAYKVIKSQV